MDNTQAMETGSVHPAEASGSHVLRPRRASCTRLIPPLAFLVVTLICTAVNLTDFTMRWPFSAKKSPHRGLQLPTLVLVRSPLSRNNVLAQARDSLEYWWYLQQKEGEVSSRLPCPLSKTGLQQISEAKQKQLHDSVKQDIDIMEAMGFSNLTTCGGRYPRLTKEPPKIGSRSDKIQSLFANVNIEAKDAEDLVVKKFCYTPTFRRPPQESLRYKNGSTQQPRLVSDPTFCPRLLELYRDISSGREPPLLTMFTYIPDPLEDAARISRRFLGLNMELFKPFVQPVLVTDRRMAMAIANTMDWPCLPVTELSPDNVPIFQSVSQGCMSKFNSTFYGYTRGTSLFDASLLETLLATKDAFLGKKKFKAAKPEETFTTAKKPEIFLYGNALYKEDLSFRSDYSAVGLMAKTRGMSSWPDKDSALTYFFHTRANFSDLPPLKIDDKYLTQFLADRFRAFGSVVIDASNTVLTVYNVHMGNTNEWDRVVLPSTRRNNSLNKVMGNKYLHSLRLKIPEPWKPPLAARFGDEGNILFDKL